MPAAIELAPPAKDEEPLAAARPEQWIIIREGKEFGELLFVPRLPHPGVFRFADMPIAEQAAEAMIEGNIIFATQSRVQISRTEGAQRRSSWISDVQTP